MTWRKSLPASQPPQDTSVDRRSFLRRLGALSAGAAGMLRPAPVLMTGQSRGSRVGEGFEFAGAWDRTTAPESDLTDLSMWEAAALLRRRKLSPSDLLQAYLDRVDRWDGVYMAFNLVMAESAAHRHVTAAR